MNQTETTIGIICAVLLFMSIVAAAVVDYIIKRNK